MLVLSRKLKDTIRIPDLDVTITILGVRGKTVRVGIEAPEQIKVLRGELEREFDLPLEAVYQETYSPKIDSCEIAP